MAQLPASLTYGTLRCRLVAAVADGPDADNLPDAKPPIGTVTLKPSVPYITVTDGGMPVIVPLKPISIEMDESMDGYFEVSVVATDGTSISPRNWSWQVDLTRLTGTQTVFNIPVPGNTVTDLANLLPGAVSSGVYTLRGPKGDPGLDGVNGANGANGLSAYEVWLAANPGGDMAGYFASIKGAKGDKGDKGDPGTPGTTLPATTFDGLLRKQPDGSLSYYRVDTLIDRMSVYRMMARSPELLVVGTITLDATWGTMLSAGVIWPDGTPGTLTTLSFDDSGNIKSYKITYGSPAVFTFTQPDITRDANGTITNYPAIVQS